MNLTQSQPTIYLCHSLIFRYLAKYYRLNEVNFYKFLLSVSDEKFKSWNNNGKIEYLKKFKIEGTAAKKICALLSV